VSSGVLHRVALVRTDVSEELTASIKNHFAFLRSVRQLLVMANVVLSSILFILMMEALSSSQTLVLTRATRRNMPEDGIVHGSASVLR
jgi:hypothetical protein